MSEAVSIVLAVVSGALLLAGAIFVLIGGMGIVRLPDFYTRLHGSGVTDTAGAGLILVGLMFQAGLTLATVKLLMILIFLLVTSPTSCHALAQSARAQGLQPEESAAQTKSRTSSRDAV